MTIRESLVRDHLNQVLFGRTEYPVPFGRVDILTDRYAVEVEPYESWQHGARQALAYAMQTQRQPLLAVYGSMTTNDIARMSRRCSGMLTLWVLDHDRWKDLSDPRDASACRPPHEPAMLVAAELASQTLRFPLKRAARRRKSDR